MSEVILRQAQAIRGLFQAALADARLEPKLWRHAAAYREYFRQFGPPERFVATFDEDLRLHVSLSDHIESMIYFHEMQEGDRGLVRFLKMAVGPGTAFIDVGANIGFHTLIAAKRAAPGGCVHAFEPVRETYGRLEENLSLNALSGVTTYRVGLSDSPATATIHVPCGPNKGMATLHRDAKTPTDPEVIVLDTLDRLVASGTIDRVDVMKVDVEGHELAVLEGAENTLKTFRPLVACEFSKEHLGRAGHHPEQVTEKMATLGYQPFALDERGQVFAHVVFEEHENLVFIHRDEVASGTRD